MGLPAWRTLDRKACKSRVEASDLQPFLVFSQHPRVGYHAGRLIESVVYRFKNQ